MKTLFGKYTVLCMALLIMAGCMDVFTPPNTAGDLAKGTLVLSIGKGAGRTIIPSASVDDFVRFNLEFTAQTTGNTSFSQIWANGGGTVGLNAGTWELTVSAYLDDGENGVKAAQKTETVTVIAGELVVLAVRLEPVASGTGTFSWTITYPAGAEASMEIIPLDENGEPDTGNPPQTRLIESEEADSITLGAGLYRVVFTLTKGEQEAVFNEVLHVYQNMESGYTKTFRESVFPVGLLKNKEEVEDYLEAADGGASVDDPVYLPIALEYPNGIGDIASSSSDSNSGYRLLLAAIEAAGKYVELDLSVCNVYSTSFSDYRHDLATGKKYIVSFILPNAVKEVSAYGMLFNSPFRYFQNLKFVSGENVTAINNSAFANISSITSVDFPAVTNIRDSAFSGCANLTSVNIPLAASIGVSAFSGCTSLTSVNTPLAASIGVSAFSGCTSLTSVNAPLAASVGSSAFSGCTSLASVNILVAASIGNNAFENTGTGSLNITLGNTAPVLGTTIFSDVTRTVRVQTPRGAEGYVENWVIGLRGRGLDGSGDFSGTTVRANIEVIIPWVTLVFTPNDTTLRKGGAVSLAVPVVTLAEGMSIAGQGWRISDDGSTWTNFVPSLRADMDLDGKFVRYYVTTSDGIITYSNAVPVSVLSEYDREVTVRMWQKSSSFSGWPSDATLRIIVNGIYKSVRLSYGTYGSDTFTVRTGDTVDCYWLRGSSLDSYCAFVMYYSDDPPTPEFSPSYGTTDTSRVLLSKKYTSPYQSVVGDGTKMGSFDVGLIGGGVFIYSPFLHEGTAFTLADPIVTDGGLSITGQDWQISDDGSTWANFSPPQIASRDLHGKYLRYYIDGGISSNVVNISIIPVNPEVTVLMWGFNYGTALRVNINGTETDITGSRTFNVETGDAVGFSWVNGSQSDRERAFVVYYTEAPPIPAFDPSTGTTDTTRVLLSKKYNNPSGSVGNGTMMGWFTVVKGIFINRLYEPSAPIAGGAFSLPAVPEIIVDGVSITARGWQISGDNGSTWSNFTPPATANKSAHHGKKLRYYVTSDEGKTYYSNAVTIMVRSTRQVTVEMYSKNLLGGWGGSAALRITVNGAYYNTVKPDILTNTDVYRFNVVSGDNVVFYWQGGGTLHDYNCGFVVYYTDVDPDPGYSFYSGSWYSLHNALFSHQFRTIGSIIGNGTEMGWFTVPY